MTFNSQLSIIILGIIMLRNCLRRHLNHTPATRLLNILLNRLNRLFQRANAHRLIQTLARQNIQRWRHELDFDLGVFRVLCFCGAKRVFDCIDAIVAETCHFDVGADFSWVRGELFRDVGYEFVFDDLAVEGDVVPNFGVARTLLECPSCVTRRVVLT